MGIIINFKQIYLDKGDCVMENLIKEIKLGNIEKEEDIENAAKRILKTAGCNKVPVPIVEIVRNLGFEVFKQEYREENLSGIIGISNDYKERLNTDKIISVNKKDNIGHKRFTIAHELAHYIFDFNRDKDTVYHNAYFTNQKENKEEKRANYFAACLLMPKKEFEMKYKENKKREMNLYENKCSLADEFVVSVKAVEKRIDELKLK